MNVGREYYFPSFVVDKPLKKLVGQQAPKAAWQCVMSLQHGCRRVQNEGPRSSSSACTGMARWATACQKNAAITLAEVTLRRDVAGLLALPRVGYPCPGGEGLELAPHPRLLGGWPSSLAEGHLQLPRLLSLWLSACATPAQLVRGRRMAG